MTDEKEVERVRRKMKGTFDNIPVKHDELPQMETSDITEEENQAEVKRVKEKSEDSGVGVVKKVMKDPEVQNVLKTNINRQTFISGLFMSFLLIGFLEVSQAIKQIFLYTWQFDLTAGIIMITVGGIYMFKEIYLKK